MIPPDFQAKPQTSSGDRKDAVKVCLKCRSVYRARWDICPKDGTPLATSDLAPGTMLANKYRIVSEIGRGGMGVVFRAEHIIMGKTVAIKVVHPLLSVNPLFLEMFRSEARHAATFKHDNVLTVHDFGESDGRFYLVMELLQGENLKSLLHREGGLIPERAFRILLRVCDAVAAAHRAGVLHLDLKTENVFLPESAGQDMVKVLDFGLARPKTDATPQLDNGMTIGTVGYMAPEQIMAGNVDERTDIYAIGVMAFEMLTGRLPFVGDSKEDVLQSQLKGLTQKFPRAAVLRIVPRDTKKAIAACFSANPERRPQSVDDLADTFQHTINEIERGAKRYAKRTLRDVRGREDSDGLVAKIRSMFIARERKAAGPPAPEGMVYIPAGDFVMGSDAGFSDERPAVPARLDAYFIDITPVTNLEYAKFVQATDHKPPLVWKTISFPSGTAELPVTGVTWQDAADYANWAGKRLPTEAEWEKAARGTDGRIYPWGNNWDATFVNWSGNPRLMTGATIQPVGSFPNDRSAYGCLDMAGNVKEWTSSWYKPYGPTDFKNADFGEKFMAVRGGSCQSNDKNYLRTTNRSHVNPDEAGDIGFRCVKDIHR